MENPYFFPFLIGLILISFSGILLLIFSSNNNQPNHENLEEKERSKCITRRKEAAHKATQQHLKITERLDHKAFNIEKMAVDKKYHARVIDLRGGSRLNRQKAKIVKTTTQSSCT